MKRFLKVLHTLGSVGLMGGFAANLVLDLAPITDPQALAAVRAGLELSSRFILFPSMLLVVLSGLLGIAVHRPFHYAGWVWLKAGTMVLVFEATLHLQAYAKDAAQLTREASLGKTPDPALMAEIFRGEQLQLWVMLVVCFANVVLGVWRPKLRREPVAA